MVVKRGVRKCEVILFRCWEGSLGSEEGCRFDIF